MPNYEELAKGMSQPFGGVGQMQPAPGSDPNFRPTLDPVTVWNAMKAVGEYFKNQITQPIQGTMDSARMGQYNLAPGQGVAPNPMNPLAATMMGIGAGWKGGLPKGETGVGMTARVGDWSSIKSAIESIPRYRHGGLGSLSELHAQFPNMPKAEFDDMVLGLAKEGKIALHKQDLPAHYKGEMIEFEELQPGPGGKWEKGKGYYHAFAVKPEWRGDVGESIKAFRGTSDMAKESSFGWFTTDEKQAVNYANAMAKRTGGNPKIIPEDIVLRNPYITKNPSEIINANAETAKRLIDQGYDGMIYRNSGGVPTKSNPYPEPKTWIFKFDS